VRVAPLPLDCCYLQVFQVVQETAA
jgi:hypothetical protein